MLREAATTSSTVLLASAGDCAPHAGPSQPAAHWQLSVARSQLPWLLHSTALVPSRHVVVAASAAASQPQAQPQTQPQSAGSHKKHTLQVGFKFDSSWFQ